MIGLPDPETRKFLANGTADLMQHHIYPHIARGLKIISVDAEKCKVVYNGKELEFPTAQQLKLTIAAVNKLLRDNGPKSHETNPPH